ncbi:MAG: hypothetical protein J7599_24195 [Niabella sp.]|nr:hypothetical protein [Niabella sp.]
MKKILIIACLLQLTTEMLNAQTWSGSTPGNIYYNQGAVGIGTSSPSSTLHVTNQSAGGNVITVENYQYDGLLGGLHFASGYDNFQCWSGIEAYGTGGVNQQDLRFYVTYGTRRQAMRINQVGDVSMNKSLTVDGYVGVGTSNPLTKLHVAGDMVLEKVSGDPILYTGTGNSEFNRYLTLINSPALTSASGLKAGGVLISDAYDYANPGKNDLVVKGNASIGAAAPPSGYKFAVAGKAIMEEVKVKLQASGWPDYVFKPSYRLMPLKKVERFIRENGHLPEVPSAKQIEQNGVEVGANQAVLLKKIEELTLYIIDQQKQITQLQQDIKKVTGGKRKR